MACCKSQFFQEDSTMVVAVAWAFIFGTLTGFRSMLPAALLSWAAWHDAVPLKDTKFAFLATPVAAILLILLAVAELIVDKLPNAPNRTAPLGLMGRVIMGALTGGALAASMQISWWPAASIGAFGGLFGAALGFSLRQYFVTALRRKDWEVAVVEDILTFVGATWVIGHF
jgi:uncharacterized membrane protein